MRCSISSSIGRSAGNRPGPFRVRLPAHLAFAALLASCTAGAQSPNICDLSGGLRSWRGAHVAATGLLADTRVHGVYLNCGDGREDVWIAWSDHTVGRTALETYRTRALMEGLELTISVEGKLTWAHGQPLLDVIERADFPVLQITRVRAVQLRPRATR